MTTYPPVFNPSVPYNGYLPMPATHGSSLIIDGMIPNNVKRFAINLETDNGDKALHFNPRFEGTNVVVRNTSQSGSWGSEERGGSFPFQKGARFEVMILIEDQQYKVAVNGRHFCEYNHRIPKDYVRKISIGGDVQVTQIRFQSANPMPGFNAPPMYSPTAAGPPPPVYNPPVPVNIPIAGGMYPGKMIRISGQSNGHKPSRFNVNLVQGHGFQNNADLGLHCDVRYDYGGAHNVVVRNHRQNGGWGQEERQAPFFPFVPGQPFEMIIKAEHDKYMIAVNNQHMFEFAHRLHPMGRFDHLFINGDVQVNMIQFQ